MSEETLPLPPGVREKHGSWHYVERHVWRKLCRVEDGRAKLYSRLLEVSGGIDDAVWFGILDYASRGMKDLAESTRKKYGEVYAPAMLHHFGHYRWEEIEPTHCAQYLDWCVENKRGTVGNREKAFMSSVWEFNMRKGRARWNPWRGSRRNKERGSSTYVEHGPLVTALDRAPPELYALMAVAYVCGIRQTDLRLAQKSQVVGELLKVVESKTGKLNEHEITKTVRLLLGKAAENTESIAARYETAAEKLAGLSQFTRAKKHRAKAAAVRLSPYIFLSRRGLPWSESGLQSALRRFGAGFKFRQLRPKAQTDRPDKNILGHTGQMRELYTKKRRLSAVK